MWIDKFWDTIYKQLSILSGMFRKKP